MKIKDRTYAMAVLHICMKNIASLAFFILIAMSFNNWWIVLFSIAFQSRIPSPICVVDPTIDDHYIFCSFCGEILKVKDLEHVVHDEMYVNNWKRLPCPNGWLNVCPHCSVKYDTIIERITSSRSEE